MASKYLTTLNLSLTALAAVTFASGGYFCQKYTESLKDKEKDIDRLIPYSEINNGKYPFKFEGRCYYPISVNNEYFRLYPDYGDYEKRYGCKPKTGYYRGLGS